ncbi:hypothetical protein HCA73_16250 [Listeria booriae]|uniref:hypothetical protein n=1 Tax=Listeria booriae TaxID=1552123 RepID=UPI001627633B|nr:hypothetical protein [Listeria booriae]MBC1914205.1 hypothetical protein [Listeria booriae]MDT0111615.1 hypothetical protein [Listeria booriae]
MLKIKYVISILLVLLAVTSSILWYRAVTRNENQATEKEITQINTSTAAVKKATNAYTIESVNKEITDMKVNLSEDLNRTKADITKGMQYVYAETKTQAAYDQLEKKIKPLLGDSLSKKVMALDKPIVAQTGKAQFPYDKIKQIQVFYGAYDITSQTIDCYILVNYLSPQLDATTTGIKAKAKQIVMPGQDFFSCTYDVANKQLDFTGYQHTSGEASS